MNLEGDSYAGDFERQMKKGSGNRTPLNEGALRGEPGGRAPLLGTPKDVPSKALEIGICFHRGPIVGNMGTLLS